MRFFPARLLLVFVPGCLLAGAAVAGGHDAMFGPKKPPGPETILVIHAGTLLAEPGEAPLEKHSVIVRNDRIDKIIPGFVAADGIDAGDAEVEVLDLRDHFVMPGLFDSHVHLSRATGTYRQGMPAINDQPAPATATVNAMINARLNLAAGFTALRDLGSDNTSVFAVRDAINAGNITGPTIIASGASISVTAGHGDDAASPDPDERARAGVCDGPDECRTLTRHLEKSGADLIKIKITGGFSSNSGLRQHMTQEEMAAIINAAHLRDLQVTAHAYANGAILEALDAGVDCIEHGYLLDDAALKQMKRNGTFLVPTLTVAEPPAFVKRFMRGREASSVTMRDEYQAFERAYKKGVKVAFGTDVGIYPHGRNADELVRMVELGMAPADVLKSATVVAAELFGVDGLSGTIEPGVYADIVAVEGSPLDDMTVMRSVSWVIKSGSIVKRAGEMQLPLDYSLEQKY